MKEISNFIVNSHDADGSGTVRLSCAVRYMQECANLQLKHTHPTSQELAEHHQAFIISRMSVKCVQPLFAYDDIEVQSWLKSHRGVTFERLYRIVRGGHTVAEATSEWCLLGEGHKLLRSDTWDNTPHMDDDSVQLGRTERIIIPRDMTLEYVGKKSIAYGDIDSNRHMNNTNYPDMYCTFIPELNEPHTDGVRYFVSDYTVRFINEAPLGEELTVYRLKEDNKYLFKTVRADGEVNTEAKINIIEY